MCHRMQRRTVMSVNEGLNLDFLPSKCDFFGLRCNDFDCRHEHIGGNGHTKEQETQCETVEACTAKWTWLSRCSY